MMDGRLYTPNELLFHNKLWCSLDHHGRFSHPVAAECLQQINTELSHAHNTLARAEWLFVTFGTAWGYRSKNTGRMVANCHRLPASDFERVRLEVDEICTIWSETIARLRQFNPAVRVIFSVSPIRHLRDGAHENQLSKAILLLAVDRLTHEVTNTGYFPAFELLLDELRDYRFYSEDMTHPGDTAIHYILQRFCESYMTNHTLQTMTAVEEIVKAAAHRPIHATSAYRKFANNCLEKISRLNRQYPQFDFTKEAQRFVVHLAHTPKE
jgi:hypothetical protein